MLVTPLGKIKIKKNGKEIEYIAKEYECNLPIVREKPLGGCYRISVDFEENDTIICEIEATTEIKRGNSGGDNYACKVFQKGSVELTIGTFDEVNECTSVCDYLGNGLIFENLTLGKTNQIIFGISWVTDLYENDNRTWFASDPTM